MVPLQFDFTPGFQYIEIGAMTIDAAVSRIQSIFQVIAQPGRVFRLVGSNLHSMELLPVATRRHNR